MKFGVIRFPGSCDDVDALAGGGTGRRGRAAVARRPRPAGRRRGGRPRRLLLRRLPARRRDRPLCAGDGGGRRSSPRDGGLVLGICNGFQVLCEAGLLPGALLPNTSLKFVFRQVELDVVDTDTPFTRACAAGQRLSIPVKHTTGRYYAPEQLDVERQVLLRYAPGPEPERLAGRHRRRLQRGGQRVRADAAPRARGRSADRLGRRPVDLRVDASACRRTASVV